jgi:sec-independent protein translocase protein TatA
MPFNLGGPELIIILVIVLIIFGAGKLPGVMRDFGKGVNEFKKAQKDEEGTTEAMPMTSNGAVPSTTPAPTTVNSAAPSNGVARTAEPAPRA